MIYTFYTDGNINNPIFAGDESQLENHEVFKNVSRLKGEEFELDGTKYRILDTTSHTTLSPEVSRGINILCEEIS